MSYTKTTWQDLPNTSTPITATRLNNMENGIKNNDTNIGEENYDNTKTYEVGDIVRYNEKIYKCITAITTAENFDNSKWEQTNIVEIVQSEKSKIYDLIEALSTPIVGEGENITLNDTAKKRFENFDIEGNSEQATRSGKNKLQNTLESQTINGLTVVVNDDKTIKINGTATANTLLTIGTMTFIANQQYYVSGCPSGGSDSTYRIDYRTSSDAVPFIEYGQGATLNRTDDITLTAKIRIASGATLSNLIFAPMVTEGSTATPYEQYGASPSPDYPSEVKSCGDNINIFDITKYNFKNNNGADSQINNKADFRITALINNDNLNVRFKILDLTNYAGKTLSMKAFIKSSTDTNNAFMVLRQNNSDNSGTATNTFYDESQRTTDGVIVLDYKVADTISDSNRYLFITFYATRGTVCNIGDYVDYKVKLVPNTDAGEYSEYGQGCITEIIANKNFFDKDNTEWIRNNSADYHSTGNSNTTRIRTQTLTKLKGDETYTISGFPTGISLNAVKFYENSYSTEPTSTITTSTFTVPSNATYAIFQFAGENFTDATNILMKNANIQVEKGSTATTYIEHQSQSYTIPTQQPMREIGDTRDKFILKENGKWYERHNIKEVILTGNENWSQRNQGDGTNTITFNFNLLNVGAYGSNNVLCDKFVYEQNSSSGNEGIGFESSLVTQYIQINRSRLSSENLAGFKAWLSNNNTKVYYKLITPTDIECTSEQTEILNQMYIKAKSYKGVTHIYSNDAVSPNCYVEAVKDLTTLL